MSNLLRVFKIIYLFFKYDIDKCLMRSKRIGNKKYLFLLLPWNLIRFNKSIDLAMNIRLICEDLGPIFVKLGQMISTRKDLLNDEIAKELAKLFWPGPLTIVVKASKIVASNVNCNNGYVGLRSPKHNAIRSIIQYAQTPIAAPSANISGKVSSTCLEHVKKYFESCKINIINDNDYISEFGIESTVVKLENSELSILRQGFITEYDIKLFYNKYCKSHYLKILHKTNVTDNISPGQLKSHYCPNKPLYILNLISYPDDTEFQKNKEEICSVTNNYLKNSILIDFNSICFEYKDKFLGYVDLSSNGDFKEAMFNLYNVFHQLNDINCDKILIYNFGNIENIYTESIWDKITRASINNIYIPINFF